MLKVNAKLLLIAVTLVFVLSLAAAIKLAATAAAPDISDFMSDIDEPVLMLRPPESKVTPFPTSARVFLAPAGLCSNTTMLGLL